MAFALTFDDGPGPSTSDLLDVLRSHSCQATFFVLGENVTDASKPDLIQSLRDGNLIGNHTMSHNARLALKDLRQEILACDALIRQLYEDAGVRAPVPIPFRLPFGIRTFISEQLEGGVRKPAAALDNRLMALASMGRCHVHWTSILRDWKASKSEDAEMLAKMAIQHIEQMENEGLDTVLALHDGSQRDAESKIASREFTVQAVDQILSVAKRKGWKNFRVPVV